MILLVVFKVIVAWFSFRVKRLFFFFKICCSSKNWKYIWHGKITVILFLSRILRIFSHIYSFLITLCDEDYILHPINIFSEWHPGLCLLILDKLRSCILLVFLVYFASAYKVKWKWLFNKQEAQMKLLSVCLSKYYSTWWVLSSNNSVKLETERISRKTETVTWTDDLIEWGVVMRRGQLWQLSEADTEICSDDQ